MQILETVQAFFGSEEEAEEKSAGGKKLEIKRFVIRDAKVGVSLDGKPFNISIPTPGITGLREEEDGITGDEVIGALLSEVTSQVVATIAKNPIIILEDELLNGRGESGENALKKSGSLFRCSKDEEKDK